MLRVRGRRALGRYIVLIVNCRVSQCCHRLLGQQHPAPCLPVRPSELSRSSLYQLHVACFSELSISSQSTHHVGTGHTADGTLTACQSCVGVGVYLYAGLEFWTFFQPQSQGSTYMWIALYAGIYGTSLGAHSTM